ncbi:Uncharacterised protein [Salmonella enterica subsp. enterica serovar Bovismorbificans]|uniref:Uncharacterized protein n=1 Tax=Salmonella enterica subsp. enterica serovar Bovismorbificans TaxID=58097 RepID=A0A655ECZ3_SALET|nr:Uncharacterised protein [Salmonella enterica subsp. enterica serovar Bovismorbificans]
MPGTNRHCGILRLADFAYLLHRRFPRPGFPDTIHQPSVAIDQLPGVIPAQLAQPAENFARETGLMQRLLHKLRVIVLLDIIILHDMDERTRFTVFPGACQLVN